MTSKNESENKGTMMKSPSVMKQLKELESENLTNQKHTKGSTNEIQPMVSDDGLNQ
ncbi:hypothetical protein AAC03nite_28460 [Alicyclobacillus acidoterrestris]|uniref:hypothetical protein n=1 Tax=Alicyclobacillus suci TaxID=2816080 RepID=UPI001195E71F|nr:hypothetical protein [Alicyclobacillus suci]GEO27061.1 hypothetical protein AAC03nite_28460 [Alicyclobacillus acidoterrestris]